MKTTIEISDALIRAAKKAAAREGTTLRNLVERGLRHVIADGKAPRVAFKLRRASFKGKGLQREFENASWDEVREAIYRGRGG